MTGLLQYTHTHTHTHTAAAAAASSSTVSSPDSCIVRIATVSWSRVVNVAAVDIRTEYLTLNSTDMLCSMALVYTARYSDDALYFSLTCLLAKNNNSVTRWTGNRSKLHDRWPCSKQCQQRARHRLPAEGRTQAWLGVTTQRTSLSSWSAVRSSTVRRRAP